MKYTVIASAFRADEELSVNINNTFDALYFLRDNLGLYVTGALGVYKEEGQTVATEETSMVIPVQGPEDVKIVSDYFCKYFNQDAVLLIDAECNAKLLFSDSTERTLGKWTPVSEKRAKDSGIYTVIKGQYFICK